MLLLFVSASGVCIALGATLSTLQPETAFEPVNDPLAGLFARTDPSAGRAAGPAAPRGRQAPVSGFVGPGLGWG
jgi:hypothetical protein